MRRLFLSLAFSFLSKEGKAEKLQGFRDGVYQRNGDDIEKEETVRKW